MRPIPMVSPLSQVEERTCVWSLRKGWTGVGVTHQPLSLSLVPVPSSLSLAIVGANPPRPSPSPLPPGHSRPHAPHRGGGGSLLFLLTVVHHCVCNTPGLSSSVADGSGVAFRPHHDFFGWTAACLLYGQWRLCLLLTW
jgi:hypothetical protein